MRFEDVKVGQQFRLRGGVYIRIDDDTLIDHKWINSCCIIEGSYSHAGELDYVGETEEVEEC